MANSLLNDSHYLVKWISPKWNFVFSEFTYKWSFPKSNIQETKILLIEIRDDPNTFRNTPGWKYQSIYLLGTSLINMVAVSHTLLGDAPKKWPLFPTIGVYIFVCYHCCYKDILMQKKCNQVWVKVQLYHRITSNKNFFLIHF